MRNIEEQISKASGEQGSAQCQLEDVHSSVSGQYSDGFMATSDYSTRNKLPSDGRPNHRPGSAVETDAWRIISIEDSNKTAARPATRTESSKYGSAVGLAVGIGNVGSPKPSGLGPGLHSMVRFQEASARWAKVCS
ncbi:hypothetical protein Q8A67_022890 [Cirrhinus molitorella]|uniref:Uncharacterized protein n=1 Tax=Cirrhinus molitorella TaxID=172907 RepID=A0AA88PGH7_9TELE|nr:hypothetical protein Q8A67_022890 [Cirrhinus molitorella]